MVKMISQWKSNEDSSIEAFKEAQENKIAYMKKECNDEITGGFLHSIGGREYKFSYDMEAQTNMQETYQLFQNNVISTIKWSAKTGETSERLTLSKTQFELMFYAGVQHKQSLISKYKDDIEPLLISAKSIKELDEVLWRDKEKKSIPLKLSQTMDKELVSLAQKAEMSDMAIMEIAFMFMGGVGG